MGFFSSLVKAILTSNGASTSARTPATEGVSDSAAMSARNGRHPAARVIDIDGDTEKVIYTYLGAVFKGVKKERCFTWPRSDLTRLFTASRPGRPLIAAHLGTRLLPIKVAHLGSRLHA